MSRRNLKLDQLPSAFVAIGEKHNALVDLLRTMTGTGMASVVFSEGKIIISVPTVSTTGGSITVPDPLTIGTINVTNLNATNESVSYLVASSATAGSLYATNVNATSITATRFWGDLSASSVTSTNVYATSVTSNQFYGNLSGSTVTASTVTANQLYGNLLASVVTTDSLYLDYLSSITVDAEDGLFYYVESLTANIDHIDAESITVTSITATSITAGSITASSITAADFFGGSFHSTKNGVVTMDGRSVTFYVDAYTYGETSSTQYLSSTSNSVAYFGAAGITINNNFSGAGMTILASSITRNITLREIDVCDSGTPKKMTILATAAY